MKKMTAHSKSSLFLMEMILSILILALTCTACVRVLAAAKSQRQKARELNHIQELTTSAGEALEGWDGEISSYVKTFGNPGYDPEKLSTSESAGSSMAEINAKTDDHSSADNITQTDSNSTGISSTARNTPTYLLNYYYDSEWNVCSEPSALYTMTIQLSVSDSEKTADLNFYDSRGENLYQLSVTFPFENRKDGRS